MLYTFHVSHVQKLISTSTDAPWFYGRGWNLLACSRDKDMKVIHSSELNRCTPVKYEVIWGVVHLSCFTCLEIDCNLHRCSYGRGWNLLGCSRDKDTKVIYSRELNRCTSVKKWSILRCSTPFMFHMLRSWFQPPPMDALTVEVGT